jgi:hypothetical protein
VKLCRPCPTRTLPTLPSPFGLFRSYHQASIISGVGCAIATAAYVSLVLPVRFIEYTSHLPHVLLKNS